MADDTETAPLPEPVPQPVQATEPAAEVVVTPAAAPAVADAAAPSTPHYRRNRALGIGAQATGVIGIVLFVVLAVVVLLGRGWATSTVDDVSGGVDAKLAQAAPLIDNASAKVSEINGRIGALTDAANTLAARAADASTNPGLLSGLREQFANLQSRYQDFRTSYSGVRDTAMAALDRLQTIDRLIPGFTLPQGPIDALTAVDAQFQELDAKITDISNSLTDGPVQQVATVIAEKTAGVQSRLTNVTTVLGDAQTRLTELRADVASTADRINTWLTILSFLLFVLFLYFAFLHWLLFHVGGRLRREASAG